MLLFVCAYAKAQHVHISCYEKRWAFFHPIAAFKVKKTSNVCRAFYDAKNIRDGLDNFENGGKIDAFRHAFFMAAFSQKINARKIRKLGIAHEKGNYRDFKHARLEDGELPDSLGTVMDLKNNELGITLGNANKLISLEELKKLVIDEIKNGRAVIMKRKNSGIYIDCKDNIIDMGAAARKWNIPKCLVSSNFVYID